MKKMITPIKVILVMLSITLGLLLPILLYFMTGTIEHSISSYHYCEESRDALFILLILISMGFYVGRKEYIISGILLTLIAIINIEYLVMHDIVAIIFFLYTSIIMSLDKRFSIFSIPIFISILLLPFGELYIFEIISILSICIYNLLYVLRYFRLFHSK